VVTFASELIKGLLPRQRSICSRFGGRDQSGTHAITIGHEHRRPSLDLADEGAEIVLACFDADAFRSCKVAPW
jgi:hypothetical protein